MLGYTSAGATAMAVKSLLPDERATLFKSNLRTSDVSGFPNRGMSIVSESGVYRLVMRAQTHREEAIAFQDWVTRVVLPTIRKTGGYIMGEEKLGASCFRHVAD